MPELIIKMEDVRVAYLIDASAPVSRELELQRQGEEMGGKVARLIILFS